MQQLKDLALFTVSVGGVSFTMRRRTTGLMAQIGNPSVVFGLLAKANKNKEATAEEMTKGQEEYEKMLSNICPVTLVAINGEPVENMTIEPGDLDPAREVLLQEFLVSGLTADPTPGSCKGEAEPS